MDTASGPGAIRRSSGSVVNAPLPTGYPLHLDRIGEDVPIAQRVVITHQPEEWPTGPVRRNDHNPCPCCLHRWGWAVLQAAGWPEADIAELVGQAKAGELPWARP